MKKVLSIVMTLLVAVTFMPSIGIGNADIAAAKTKNVKVNKPVKVKWQKCTAGYDKITLKWKKAKYAKKYEVQVKRPYKTWNKFKTVKKTKENKKRYTRKGKYKVKVVGKKYQVYKYSSAYTKTITSKKTLTIKKLKPGKQYKVRVRGINRKVAGKFSVVKKIKTKVKAKKKTDGTSGDRSAEERNKSDSNADKKDNSSEHNNSSANGNTSSVQQIAFAKSAVSMTVNGTETLILSNPSVADVTYTSSNTSVVEVERSSKTWAVINAKGAGEAIITAKAGDKTATCVVRVGASGEEGSLQRIYFDNTSVKVKEGAQIDLYLCAEPWHSRDKEGVKYSCEDNSIAKIITASNYSVMIRGMKAGTTTITATCSGKKATATITVEKGELNYSYEIYRLREGMLFSNGGKDNRGSMTNLMVILTTNPDPEELGFVLADAENEKLVHASNYERPSKALAAWPNEKYRDMNIPDMIDGKYVYLSIYHFEDEGTREYKLVENDSYTSTYYISPGTCKITTYDYETKYNEWLNSYLERFSEGTPKERFDEIIRTIRNEATYTKYDSYDPNNSIRLQSIPAWMTYHWDSAYHKPMIDFAKMLGATSILGYEDVGKDNSYHAYEWITFPGEKQSRYTICPDSSTAEDISKYENTITISSYERIAAF